MNQSFILRQISVKTDDSHKNLTYNLHKVITLGFSTDSLYFIFTDNATLCYGIFFISRSNENAPFVK